MRLSYLWMAGWTLAGVLGVQAALSEDAQALGQDILGYGKLTGEQREQLVERLSKKSLKPLSSEQREQIQRACVDASATMIGHNAKGQLKVVKDPGAKAIMKLAGDYLNRLPAATTPAHPAAEDLFGQIPEKAPRVKQSVKIDPAVVRWQATGLYAAPGELVTLVFPDAWVGKGLQVHVSGHRDNISVKKNLMRLPTKPSRSFPVDSKEVKVAAAFGGALYIDTGNKVRAGKSFQVQVNHALQAPYFVLGKSDPKAWREQGRLAPAPYAELVTDRIALSFPSAWIRDLADPTELLKYWDKVVALHDELGGMAHTRYGPERVNVDVQISVGLFHAGYPMQGPQKQCRGVVDLEKLKIQGNWGWFHELGHEAQRRPDKAWGWNNPYTFDGSVEVTVNLFSSHAMDRLKMENRGGWSWTASPEEVRQRAHKALSTGKSYSEFGAGEKLAMYLLLRDQFGWESIGKVLAGYCKDQDAGKAMPKENQAKRDAFVLRMSKQTGHNLTPYVEKLWGVKISPETAEQLKALPVWIPKGFDKYMEG
ncbi:hypothetical protein HW115_06370 [Verrucomicrobiaceae bacterium N1E253]|uniref:Peptidase M60 domain-containing protein n=1 Tax=Oceaniferula marina TaxID=2748318 RepID=A0A851GJE6_9BACT|nr:M60 family metallopeptidase [Oceaniferula marina]NWK55227.1 hypothetical protein [Oceaniferula marina]